jgi:chromosomal replication initiator protein
VDIIEENTPDTKAICRRTASVVARHYGLTASDLRGKSRRQAVADARALAMYLVRGRTGASYAEVGRHFGNRDHTTVLHACRKLSAQTARDQATRRLANDIAEQISEEE